jgi:tRNA uridine 5-carbamoylmethylation protein Kti12
LIQNFDLKTAHSPAIFKDESFDGQKPGKADQDDLKRDLEHIITPVKPQPLLVVPNALNIMNSLRKAVAKRVVSTNVMS